MSFKAPTLITDPTTLTEISANTAAIQTAFTTIENELPTASTVNAPSNLSWVDHQLEPDGVVGHDSFAAEFGTEEDLFRVRHGMLSGFSRAILSGNLHQTVTAFSKSFSDVLEVDGTFEVVFGVKSLGSPALQMFLELESTDKEQDLTIWKMDVTQSGASYGVANLTRVAPVHMDRGAWGGVLDIDVPLTYQRAGLLPLTSGRLDTGILVPWNCEVTGAFIRLETQPAPFTDADDVVIELDTIEGTDATNVLADQATFTDRDGDGAVKTLSAITPDAYQLRAGEYVYPNIVTPEQSAELTDNPQRAGGLSVTLTVRRIYHDILR
jgi:hypothetical protein